MRGVVIDGELVRARRLALGWTQEQLAAVSQLDVRTVRHAEAGNKKVDLRTAGQLASSLGCELNHLLKQDIHQAAIETRHLQTICRWYAALLAADMATLVDLHTEDITWELPGAHRLPAFQSLVRGRSNLRRYLVELFKLFRFSSAKPADYKSHAVGNLVLLRTSLTTKYLPNGMSCTTPQFDEFEFSNGLISWRFSITDWTGLHATVRT